jgi:hypothetical protein
MTDDTSPGRRLPPLMAELEPAKAPTGRKRTRPARVEIYEGDPSGASSVHPRLGPSLSRIAHGFSMLGVGPMRGLVAGLKGIRNGEPATELDGTENALRLFRSVQLTMSQWGGKFPGLSGINYRATVAETRLEAVSELAGEVARRVEVELARDDE